MNNMNNVNTRTYTIDTWKSKGMWNATIYCKDEHIDLEFDLDVNIIDDSFDHEFGTEFDYCATIKVKDLRIVGDEHSIFKGEDLQSILEGYFNDMTNDELIEMGII